jgi:hypothetical protein
LQHLARTGIISIRLRAIIVLDPAKLVPTTDTSGK